MKKTIASILLGFLLLLIFIVAIAPASTLINFAKKQLPNKVKTLELKGVSGTLWATDIQQATFKNVSLNNIQLKISPWQLFLGEVATHLTIDDPSIRLAGDLQFTKQQMEVTETSYQLKADWLNQFMQAPVSRLDGDIVGMINTLSIEGQNLKDLNGQGDWSNAQIVVANNTINLGDFNYQLSRNEQQQAQIEILENDGPLDLKGIISIGLNKQYNLELTTTTELPDDFLNVIKVFSRQKNNRFYIKWQGHLP